MRRGMVRGMLELQSCSPPTRVIPESIDLLPGGPGIRLKPFPALLESLERAFKHVSVKLTSFRFLTCKMGIVLVTTSVSFKAQIG